MKCPKCGYVSHDYLDACRNSKCGIDLMDFKAQMQLHVIQAGHLDLVTVLGNVDIVAAGPVHESFFDSGMLESEENGDFDISLDDDLSLATMSITVDESAEISGIFNRPGFSFDMDDASASTITDRGSTSVPLGPPKSGYATVMLDVGDVGDPNDPPDEAADAVVETPTGNDTAPSSDLDDLDAGFTPATGVESVIAFTAEDPLAEVEGAEAELPAPDVIPNHTEAVRMPTESGEIDLSNEQFAPAFEVAETDLTSDSMEDLDLLETDLPEVSFSTPADEDVSASTEAAFADFLPLQSEELTLSSLSAQDETFDDDPDATMVDGANTLTLADEVFDLSSPPTQEITHVDSQDATQDQVPQAKDFGLPTPPVIGKQDLDPPQDAAPDDDTTAQTVTDDVFVLPVPPMQEVTLVDTQDVTQDQLPQDDESALPPLTITDELQLDSPQDAAPDDDATAQTVTDDNFVLPAPPMQEVTLVDTQDVTQDQLPQDDDFALPPLPVQDSTATNEDVTIADDLNSQTLLDGMFHRPSELTQERPLIETQGGDPDMGTPHPNPEEEDDACIENDAEHEFGDETPPAS